jgi:formate hydrogenlyase subunit 4
MTAVRFSSVVAAAALFIVAIAETSRIPVDNQETHLELTMVHEAMTLEYSGRSLAFIEYASYVKQVIFFSLIAAVALPQGAVAAPFAGQAALFAIKIGAIAAAVAVIEVSTAKMRLFRVPDLLAFAFMLSGIAVVLAAIGM